MHGAYADSPKYVWYAVQITQWFSAAGNCYGMWRTSDPENEDNFAMVAGGVRVPGAETAF